MSFFAELKQRKVFRVAAAYLVVAWIAIQAASIALPTFDAPVWVMRVVILLFALGLPLALVLAWAIDLTPDGLKFIPGGAGSKLMLAVAAALALLAIAWFYLGQPAFRRGLGSSTNTPVVARSIAVLPFLDLSQAKDQEYFSDGLAETTLDMLAQVPNLKVISRTSSFAFKGKQTDVRQIGEQLGAATVLEGSVERAGDAVRITVQLIRAADGSHLWSKHFDRPLADVFKIQDEIATQVVQALSIALPADQQQHLTQKRTDSVAAYQEYLKGNALLPGRKVSQMREAAQHFERAIALDPNYARAYVGAGIAYHLLGTYGTISTEERARIHTYIDSALVLAPSLGEAHLARGMLLADKPDLPGAEAEYRSAIALAPSYATAYQWYGAILNTQGNVDEGIVMLQRAASLDPRSPIVQEALLWPLLAVGRFQQAEALIAKLHADHPDYAQGYNAEAWLAVSQGDLVRALRALRRHAALDPDAVSVLGARCQILIRFGALPDAGRCVGDWATHGPDPKDIQQFRIILAYYAGDAHGALAQFKQQDQEAPYLLSKLLVAVDRDADALATFREVAPELLTTPAPRLNPAQIGSATLIGTALIRAGQKARGEALLRQAIDQVTPHRQMASENRDEWSDVSAYAALGEHDKALAALERGVSGGFFLDLVDMDADPLLAPLRADPRYEKILAPARAKAAAKVQAARSAGLL